MFQHFLRAFPLLREAFWIASGLLNVLGSFLDCFRLLLGPLDWFRLLLGFCAALDCFWVVGLQGFMSCGAADFWEATGLPEKRCAHSYCIPALRACTSTVHQHFHVCSSEKINILHEFLLCSSIFCVHFHCFGRLSGLLLGCSTFSEAFWTALDCFWALWTDLDCFLASALL